MKICKKCGIEKPLQHFNKSKRNKDGRYSYCKSCDNARTKQWYEDNKEHCLDYMKQWYENNPEYRQQWRENNKERQSIAGKQWRENNKDHVYTYNSRIRMRNNNAKGDHTAKEWKVILERYNYICLCCKISDVKLHKDHIIPLSKGGSNYANNLQPLCKSCNSKKRDKAIDYRPLEHIFLYQVQCQKVDSYELH